MASQIDFDNIFEMVDAYGNPDYQKMINELVSQFNSYLHFEKEGSYNNRSDHEFQLKLGLYYTTFHYFKGHLESYNLLNRSGNKDIDEINNSMTCFIFDSIKLCLSASATANHSLFLRLVRELYESIVIAIAINQINEKGQYVLLAAFKERLESITYKNFSAKSFLKDLKSNINKSINDRTFYNYKISSFVDDLQWTYPIFKLIDPYQKKVKLSRIDESKSWDISISNIANLLDIEGCNIVDFETIKYKHLSIFEHFSNSISPTIHRMSFENEMQNLFVANTQQIRESCNSACIFIKQVIDSFFYSIAIPNRLCIMLSNMVRVIDYVTSTSLMNGYKDEFAGLYEELPGITSKDSKFMELLKQDSKINKSQKEIIDKYFTCYKDKYLLTNDIFNVDKLIEGDENSLNNIAIKYMNVFKSLLFGLRFYDDNELPSRVTAKNTFMGYPKSVANRNAFISDEVDNYRENNFDILTISMIHGISNICNLALISSGICILEEARVLYESIIIKTYINVKIKDDESLMESLLDDYFDSLAMYMMPQQKVLNMRDKIVNNIINSETTDSSIKKKFEAYNNSYTSKICNDLVFNISKNDGISNYDDMLKYLGDRSINLHLSMFDKFYNKKSFEMLAFVNKSKLSDDEIKLIVLDLALLIFKSLKYDFLADKIDDSKRFFVALCG